MSGRHWSDYEPENDDLDQYHERDWYLDTETQADQCDEDDRRFHLRRHRKESARRKAQFSRARKALAVAATMRGMVDTTVISSWNRSGQPSELSVAIGNDQLLIWTPRGGFAVVEIDSLPF